MYAPSIRTTRLWAFGKHAPSRFSLIGSSQQAAPATKELSKQSRQTREFLRLATAVFGTYSDPLLLYLYMI